MDHEYSTQIDEKPKVSDLTPSKTRWFTGYEKQELYKIMENYKDVFNSNGIEQPSRKTKQEAWEEITIELNHRCGLNRTPAQVSLYYKNLKQRAKQRIERNMTKDSKTTLPIINKPDFIYVSSEPELVTVEPVSSTMLTEHQDIEIKKKRLELLDLEIIHKKKLMKLEMECAEKKKQLLDLEIAFKRKQLENS